MLFIFGEVAVKTGVYWCRVCTMRLSILLKSFCPCDAFLGYNSAYGKYSTCFYFLGCLGSCLKLKYSNCNDIVSF